MILLWNTVIYIFLWILDWNICIYTDIDTDIFQILSHSLSFSLPLSLSLHFSLTNLLLLLSHRELHEGIELVDEDGKHLANSRKVAKIAISQVVFSRIVMCAPGKRKYHELYIFVYLILSFLLYYVLYLYRLVTFCYFSIFSRTVLPPFIMNHLEKKGVLRRYPWISLPLQVTVCGLLWVYSFVSD